MKKSVFRSNKKFFHISLDFQTQGLLKNLEWLFIQRKIAEASRINPMEIQGLIMMDTHIHILAATFEPNEHFFCENLQSLISVHSRVQNASEPILNYSQYLNTYKYLYRNPVSAGLVKRVEDYPYSSIPHLLGRSVAYYELHDQLGLIQNPLKILNWLNRDIDYKASQLRHLRESTVL